MGVANISGNILTDSGASLSSYLPLTGGTLTGGLSGTTANFSGDVTLSKITTATGLEYQVRNTNGASGNHVFKSFNTAILTLDGGTNAATFSSSVTAASGLYNGYTSGLPPTSGSATRGGLRLNNASNIAFDFGTVAAGQAWIQVSDANNYASNFALLLNPNGGNVGIGTSSPACRLDILGTNEVMNISGTNATSAYTGYYYNTSTLVGYIGNGSSILSGAASSDFIFRSEGALVYATNGNNERMRITSAGDIEFKGGAVRANGGYFRLSNSAGTTAYGYLVPKALWLGTGTDQSPSLAAEGGYGLSFFTNGTTDERMRITSGGYTKISNTGSYEYVNASIHEVRNSAADYILYGTNPHASNPSGYYISYPSASPNNTSNYFIACADSSAARFRVASNGNCYNVTGTYTSGVSDIRYKEQIVDANSQWNDIKSLRVVNFKFIKDVEENGENALRQIGFIAQEVEEVSPNLVDEMYDEKTGESWKTIKASIIHLKAVKALQEAMARIEELEAKVTALENK